MSQADLQTRLQKLEERIQGLEEMMCLAKAKCKNCDAVLIVLPTTKYLHCDCGEMFGDTNILLAEPVGASPVRLEWIHKDGYERLLLLDHLRSDINKKYPRVLANTRIPS
jgi:hypothetical protein